MHSLTAPHPNDPLVLQAVEDAASQGISLPSLAIKLGVSNTTLWRWIDQGRAETDHGAPPLPELGSARAIWNALQRGIARFEEGRLQNIREAESPKPGGWQPSAWLLERSPYTKERYAQRSDQRIEERRTVSLDVPPEVLDELDRRYLPPGTP